MKTSSHSQQQDNPLKDFRNFVFLLWKNLWKKGDIQSLTGEPTPLQYDVANIIQNIDKKRLILQTGRGLGKSYLAAAYVLYTLYFNPNFSCLIISASRERADQCTIFIKKMIEETQFLKHMTPQQHQRSSNISFDIQQAGISQSPSVKSLGMTGQITGTRADLIIADDCETLNNSMTQTLREQVFKRVKEFEAVIKPNGRIIFLGTPQTESSVYNRLTEAGYQLYIWTSRIPEKPEIYNSCLAPYIKKMIKTHPPLAPTDPIRFDEEDLIQREALYGRSDFALQFMLDTTLSDTTRYPLKLKDFIVYPLDYHEAPIKLVWSSYSRYILEDEPCAGITGDFFCTPMHIADTTAPYTGSMMYVDPSGRGKDETAIAVTKMLNGYIFLFDCIGEKEGGYSKQTLQLIADTAKKYQVNKIIIETNFGMGMFSELLKPILRHTHPCQIEERRTQTQKEHRIITTLEPVLNQHRLVLNQSLIQKDFDSTYAKNPKYSLFYQLTRITKEPNSLVFDDRIDAVAGAVAEWTTSLAVDQEAIEKEFEEESLQKEIDDLYDKASSTTIKKNWVSW